MKAKDIWITADKQNIPIKDMTDSHLANAIAYGKGKPWFRKNQMKTLIQEQKRRVQLLLKLEEETKQPVSSYDIWLLERG